MKKTLQIKREDLPFRTRCTLCIDLPDFAHPSECDTITPIEFVLRDASAMRNIIQRGYTFEVTQAHMDEINELNLIRSPEHASLFLVEV